VRECRVAGQEAQSDSTHESGSVRDGLDGLSVVYTTPMSRLTFKYRARRLSAAFECLVVAIAWGRYMGG
jgi:hypothetical protein